MLVNPDSPVEGSLPAAEHFFGQTIGIVTPHRAQQALIITYIQRAFADSPAVTDELIRDSVDTVLEFTDPRPSSQRTFDGVARTLDGPGRSRGRGPRLLTPAGLASSYHQRRTPSRVWDAIHES